MPTILRIEHKVSRDGPYQRLGMEGVPNSRGLSCTHPNERPGPFTAGFSETHTPDAFFGHSSVKQLRRWWSKEDRLDLHRKGFVVARYYVKDPRLITFRHKTQCSFIRAKARLHRDLSLAKF